MSNISALVSIELRSIVYHENLVITQVGEGQITTVKGVSLRSKRFRAVSERRKTEERDSRFWPREK